VIPADSDNDGLPDIWESQFGDLSPTADLELSPSTTDATQSTSDSTCTGDCLKGDGVSVFDEYRGFVVSLADRSSGASSPVLPAGTKHIRTHPHQKDLFIHVVSRQCPPASSPAIHGTFARYFPAGGADMFAALYTMLPGTRIHLLDFTPGSINPARSTLWEDLYDSYNLSDPDGTGPLYAGVLFRTASGVATNKEADVPTDRQINRNAVFPITDLKTNQPIQKGVRLIECEVVDTLTTLGVNDWGTPNKAGSASAIKAGNGVVFTERVRRGIATKLVNAGTRTIQWALYNPATAKWVMQSPALEPNQSQFTQDFLAARQLQYLVGHEIAHAARLRPTSLNGYHTTTGYGSEMDATYQVTQDRSTSGKTTFYIPSQFLTSDHTEIRFKN
jgi:hypothetical protein